MDLVCVHCGVKAETLFKRYSPELIEVSKCVACRKLADHYIEYDYIIILIDIILLRIQAFRHLLFNTDFRQHWYLRLLAFTCLCEAYHHWALEHVDQQAITAAVEFSFYLKLSSAIIGVVLQVTGMLFLLRLCSGKDSSSIPRLKMRVESLVLTNYSVLYLLVVHIWSVQSAVSGYYLLKLYKTATCFIALRAITDVGVSSLMFISAVGTSIELTINVGLSFFH